MTAQVRNDTVTVPREFLQRLLPMPGYEVLLRAQLRAQLRPQSGAVPELVMTLSQGLSMETLRRLASHKDRGRLIERALELGL